MKLHIHSQTSTVQPLFDVWGFHPTLYDGCNYFSMLGLKLMHVSKRDARCTEGIWNQSRLVALSGKDRAQFQYKDRLSISGNSHIKIRGSSDLVIFIVGIPTLLRWHLCIETDDVIVYHALTYLTYEGPPFWCHVIIMTSSNGDIFRGAGPLCGEFTGHRWMPRTKTSDAELWCFLWSAPEETVE